MSDEPSPYTEADVELVAKALWEECRNEWPSPMETCRDDARAALAVLAEAGRLLPEGAGREWAAELDGGYPYSCDDEEYARWVASQRGCTGKVFARIVGPWQPITEETGHAV